MKALYVLRHAKSDWDASYGSDFDRPLSPRGLRAAALVGRFLTGTDEIPDHVIASAAVRASQTADLAVEHGAWSCNVVREASLYGASARQLLAAARVAPDSAARVMLVAHEPGISDFAGRMVGGAALRYPTAALARIDVGVESWADLDFDGGALRWMVVPRMLEAFARSLGAR